ncbi:MAG: large-conductance mechanosensitive channel protein MscL [Planctomycetaceae bacterium]|nr:large-conductance mechanosensitive channel protein MscL [Planctomycetaceae bacterium]
MSFIKEFKEFTMRGNVVDMAVGIMIGAAFGGVVSTLVENVMLPVISAVTGKFGDLATMAQKVEVPGFDPILIKYGVFLAATVKFIITAFCLFMVVKGMNTMKRKSADEPPPPAPPTKDQELLTEIRDLLIRQSRG